MIVQTEDPNSPNITWEGAVGKPLVVAFTGMARGLNELANFEFMKSLSGLDYSKVFVRDPYLCFYHKGIDESINSIPALKDKLAEVLETLQPSFLVCLGVSAGGFAAILFGHLLGADAAHAFGPQTILYKEWGEENQDPTIENCEALHSLSLETVSDFRDLKKVLAEYNGKTVYKLHVSNKCEQDLKHSRHIEDCSGVSVVSYNCEGHACASRHLRADNKLGQVIMGEYFAKFKNSN